MLDISLPSMRRRPVVLTGATCSGKTTLLKRLVELPSLKERILTLPEVFTDLAVRGIISPTLRDDGVRRNQETVIYAQVAAERTIAELASSQGLTVICDRGLPDSAVFLPGGVGEFEKIIGCGLDDVLGRYGLVVELGIPPEDVFYAVKGQNPARREAYPRVIEQAKKFAAVYGRHPNYVHVPYQSDLDRKVRLVLDAIESYL